MHLLGRRRLHLPVTESTMDDLRELAEAGAPEGTVVTAARQVGGRGRAGRQWSSPAGGLWMSVLLRPSREAPRWPLLALAAGASCVSTMRRFGAPARLKWPNDVLIGPRKVAGFLVENRVDAFMILGCGINVRVPREAMPPEVAGIATSLHEHVERPVDVDAFQEEFLRALSHRYEVWQKGGDEDILREWTEASETVGRRVHTEAGLEGRAIGVDAQGALLVQGDDGLVTAVAWGDVLTARD